MVKLKSIIAETAPPVVISTHYDGDYFGEASIIEMSNGKSYEDLNWKWSSAIAVENTLLIWIDKQLAKKCFCFTDDHDLSVWIWFLESLEIFKEVDKFLVMTLANAVSIE